MREQNVVSLVPKRQSSRTLRRAARIKRYQQIDDIKRLIAIYESRITQLSAEARRLARLNQ